MGTGDEGLHLGMRRLRQADLGDRRHGDARLEGAAGRLVLGRLPDGHPLQRHLRPARAETTGLGSYKTAWLLCAKLRRAMVAPDRPPLNGLVEIDETEIPQRSKDDPPEGGLGRSGQGKMLVAGAVEVHGHRPGRVRLAPIAAFSAASLPAFINANIAAGATAKTDGWSAYPGAPGVTHHPHVIGPMAAHVVLPWAHRLFANLKRWALGVYHGLRRKHLLSYLDEFVFRSIAATPAMPPSARCSASASPSNTSPTTC